MVYIDKKYNNKICPYEDCQSRNITICMTKSGHITAECECLSSYWDPEVIPDNLKEFNLKSKHTYVNIKND